MFSLQQSWNFLVIECSEFFHHPAVSKPKSARILEMLWKPQMSWIIGFGGSSRTLEVNSKKRSESVSGVFPGFFQKKKFLRKVPAVLRVWPNQKQNRKRQNHFPGTQSGTVPSCWTVLKHRKLPLLKGAASTETPEPLEPFQPKTITEPDPNRGHLVKCTSCPSSFPPWKPRKGKILEANPGLSLSLKCPSSTWLNESATKGRRQKGKTHALGKGGGNGKAGSRSRSSSTKGSGRGRQTDGSQSSGPRRKLIVDQTKKNRYTLRGFQKALLQNPWDMIWWLIFSEMIQASFRIKYRYSCRSRYSRNRHQL